MNIRNQKDFAAGLIYILAGGGFSLGALNYKLGEPARMGPGYFPHLVGGLLLLLGTILAVRALFRPGERVGTLDLRPLLFVLIATCAFGFLIERAGLLVASVILVVAARLARPDFRLIEVLLLAAVLAACVAALFVYALGMNVRLLPF